jgi:octaprenyl-diphosphate synthase
LNFVVKYPKEAFEAFMKEIQALIADEMLAMAEQMHALIKSDVHLLQKINRHVFQTPGKQLRPMLVLLAAGACGGITPKTLRGALLVNLLHHASLAHDDVIDEATHRRNKPTINTVWHNKVAVLFGDYLLAKILHLTTQHQDHDLLALITETIQAMSEGELRQLEQSHIYDTTEAIYLDIIYKKTAHLFGTCLALGAMTAGAPAVQVTSLRQVGEYLGIAFQLKDDWLDYGTEDLGKPLGIDLIEGKLTLPLMHALQQAPAQVQKEILYDIQHARHHPQQQENVLAFVRKSQGMDYTQQVMLQYQHKALQTLANTVATSPYQKGLCALIQHLH